MRDDGNTTRSGHAFSSSASAVEAEMGRQACGRTFDGCGEVEEEKDEPSTVYSYERDHALVLDLMEYFCYAVKVNRGVKRHRPLN